jgi:hypothetical protein
LSIDFPLLKKGFNFSKEAFSERWMINVIGRPPFGNEVNNLGCA